MRTGAPGSVVTGPTYRSAATPRLRPRSAGRREGAGGRGPWRVGRGARARPRRRPGNVPGVILSDRTIKEELASGRIVIAPLDESCIQPSSVDLHIDGS